MTMAPARITEAEYEAYFTETKKIFESIKALDIPGTEIKTLSMGMSDSYEAAARCGASLVRVGSALFGKRHYPAEGSVAL